MKEMGKEHAAVRQLLEYTDLLIDGPFVKEEKDLTLSFRGSRNQRILDMKKTRETGQAVLWKEEN